MQTKVSVFIYLSDDTDKRLRLHCAVHRESLSNVVEEALKAYLPIASVIQTKV